MSERKSALAAWAAAALFVAGLALGPVFGASAGILTLAAFVLGVIGWRRPLGKIVCFAVLIAALVTGTWLLYTVHAKLQLREKIDRERIEEEKERT